MPIVSGCVATHSPSQIMDFKGHEDMFRILYSANPKKSVNTRYDLEEYNAIQSETKAMFGEFEKLLDESRPDVLLVVANDQFVNFFLNLIPQFCIFVGNKQEFNGGGEYKYKFECIPELANYILENCLQGGFDMAYSEKLSMQHTQIVNLHYLDKHGKYPIIPLYVNCSAPPTPTPSRCYELGKTLRKILSKRKERVSLLGTGGLSHFMAGGYVPGREDQIGEADSKGDLKLILTIKAGSGSKVARHPYSFFQSSGNIEMLNWLVVLGAVGDRKAVTTHYHAHDMGYGGAFISTGGRRA